MASVKPKCQYKYDEKIERKAEKSWKIKKSLKEIHVSSVTSILYEYILYHLVNEQDC